MNRIFSQEGYHFIIEMTGGNKEKLNDIKEMLKITYNACKKAELNVTHTSAKKYNGGGISLYITLEQSHLSLHTWPEKDPVYASLDCYTCGKWNEAKPILAGLIIARNIETETIYSTYIERGIQNDKKKYNMKIILPNTELRIPTVTEINDLKYLISKSHLPTEEVIKILYKLKI